MSWYAFACRYVDMKWPRASAKYRRDIAWALIAATSAMLASTRGKPDDAEVRSVLAKWAFNTKQREHQPNEHPVLKWLERNTRPVSALTDPKVMRGVLDAIAAQVDGKAAAASTARRKRAILVNACEYAVELGLLGSNPVKAVKWTIPVASHEVDRRSVVNHAQARCLLDAIRAQKPSGPRLVAFFGVMYYAGLRPEEAVNLSKHNITLPPLNWNDETQQWEPPADDWGELHFSRATPNAGRAWTDDGAYREHRHLKHRPDGHSRRVPCPPPLTRLLRDHVSEFGTAPDGRLFRGIRGGELPENTYRRAWKNARRAALSPQEFTSPLAKRVYDLRHACVSTWLNGGVPATQVAEWAGHSVEVLLRIYAKCLDGQDEIAKRRIEDALRLTENDQD